MATNCHKFPNIMLPKSLDGDSAPIRFQTGVPLTVKALLLNHASLLVVILGLILHGLWEALTHACADLSSRLSCRLHNTSLKILASSHGLVIECFIVFKTLIGN